MGGRFEKTNCSMTLGADKDASLRCVLTAKGCGKDKGRGREKGREGKREREDAARVCACVVHKTVNVPSSKESNQMSQATNERRQRKRHRKKASRDSQKN